MGQQALAHVGDCGCWGSCDTPPSCTTNLWEGAWWWTDWEEGSAQRCGSGHAEAVNTAGTGGEGGVGVGVQWGLSSAPGGAALGCSLCLGGAGRGSPGCKFVGQQLELLWFEKQINAWMFPGWAPSAGWGAAGSHGWGAGPGLRGSSQLRGAVAGAAASPALQDTCADGTKLPLPIGLSVDIPKPLPCKHMDYPHNPDSVLEKPPGISGRIAAATRDVGGSGRWETRGSNANQPEGRGAAPSSRGAGDSGR